MRKNTTVTTVLNTSIGEAGGKIPDLSGFVTTTVLDTEIREMLNTLLLLNVINLLSQYLIGNLNKQI